MDELRARVERIVGEMTEVKSAWPDIGMEPRPKVRQQLAEEWRVLCDRIGTINREWTTAAKGTARIDRLRSERARSIGAIDVMERRSETAPERERDHWRGGACYLRGEGTDYELPGAVKAMCKELGVDRLPPLRMCDEMLAQAEADLAPHVARLQTELDAWDSRCRTASPIGSSATTRVRASINAALPAADVKISTTVS
ncbi:MAG: hypothetical protein Q8T13_19870 [Acidobacteriota bacterium]|nr:hypothetical protein [Acidobacteriota bacterium]